MNSNAMESMIVPVVRGVFLILMLGAAARGLVRMFGIIAASARHPDEPAAGALLASQAEVPAAPDRRPEETLAGVVA